MKVEIVCPSCGAESLLLRKPEYEGLKKVGETLACASCGHTFASEEDVPYKEHAGVQVFTEEDRSQDVKVFEKDEKDRLCRYCANYVVNPFTQWCGRHKKEVEATDTCGAFERRKESGEGEENEASPL
ncbi:MAG: hypothetical protein KJ626_11970 [Verrucomicrobia bacterium]|nr:hypothetical protein [Verrucomicrobiota bacterium]